MGWRDGTMHCHGYAAAASRAQWAKGWLLAMLVAALAAQAAIAAPAQRTVLVFGDSLSAGYGMAARQGWVALLGERLAARKPGWKVVNASVSGETTAGGVSRIAKVLQRTDPDVVVIELGANDGLRGLPLQATRDNLARMVDAAEASGAAVLLVGMRMPPNLGRAYTEGFEANFRAVAKDAGVPLLPFLLEPVADDPGAFQADDLHPTAAAQPKLLEHVWKALAPLLALEP
jgi:acyl-CoA thioesterase-1